MKISKHLIALIVALPALGFSQSAITPTAPLPISTMESIIIFLQATVIFLLLVAPITGPIVLLLSFLLYLNLVSIHEGIRHKFIFSVTGALALISIFHFGFHTLYFEFSCIAGLIYAFQAAWIIPRFLTKKVGNDVEALKKIHSMKVWSWWSIVPIINVITTVVHLVKLSKFKKQYLKSSTT